MDAVSTSVAARRIRREWLLAAIAGLLLVLLVVVALFGLGVMGGPVGHGRGVADRQTRLLSLSHGGGLHATEAPRPSSAVARRRCRTVSILNTDGLTLFGPGSEWLWTMAQFVALTGTGFAIYRQLRALRFGNELSFRKSVDDEWMTERMVRFRLAAMLDVARGRQELTISDAAGR